MKGSAVSPRKTSDQIVFQTTQFRRPTLGLEDRGVVAPLPKAGQDTLELLEKVIWPEPLEQLLPPDEWAPDAPEPDRDPRNTASKFGALEDHATQTDVLGAGLLVDGRYEVIDQLGSGGMARVLKVLHKDLGRTFALKIIHPGRIADDRYRKALLREARVVSQLEHPNIVQVTDFGADPEFGVFVVMEYLKGTTLYDRLLDEGRFPLKRALDITRQTAEALRYMHAQNLVHRDIKPENIFLVRPPEDQRQIPGVRLIDFGLSGPDAKATFKASSGVVGTPTYMAPEQIQGLAPRVSMDIYAVGVLLYELLTGRPPFVGALDEIIAAHVMQVPPEPSQYLDEPLDESVEKFILKALSKRPEERQATMQALVYELHTLMDMLGHERGHRRHKTAPAARPGDSPEKIAFESIETPLFLLDAENNLSAVNASMAKFMRQPLKALLGTSLADSQLATFYPELEADLQACRAHRQGARRVVQIPRDPEPAVQIMVWFTVVDRGEADEPWISGFIVPFVCGS